MELTHTDDKLGYALQALRKSKNITQETLRITVGVGQAHLSQIESRRKIPSLRIFKKIITALKPTCKEALQLRDYYFLLKYKDITKLNDWLDAQYESDIIKDATKSLKKSKS